jgi:hypothetical protein
MTLTICQDGVCRRAIDNCSVTRFIADNNPNKIILCRWNLVKRQPTMGNDHRLIGDGHDVGHSTSDTGPGMPTMIRFIGVITLGIAFHLTSKF